MTLPFSPWPYLSKRPSLSRRLEPPTRDLPASSLDSSSPLPSFPITARESPFLPARRSRPHLLSPRRHPPNCTPVGAKASYDFSLPFISLPHSIHTQRIFKHCQASIPKHRADCAGSRTNGLEGKRRVVSTAACHPWVQDTRPLLFSLCSRKWVCLTRTACPLGGSGRISSPLFGDGVCQPKSRRQIPQSR